MQRIVTCTTGAALAILLAAGLWLRVTSLESMPYPDGDEAWYGIQAQRFLAGKPVAWLTPTGNPLNPFYAGAEVPLLAAFRPALWVLRVPSAACGILAVVLAYVFTARLFDRTTGLIAATLFSSLPVAIVFSRIGFDASQTPLLSLIALYLAFRGRMLATPVAFLACLLIHPTNVFLAPILLAVLAAKVVESTPSQPRKRAWSLGMLATVPGLAIVAFGIYTLHKPSVQSTYATPFRDLDWPRFLTLYGRLFLAIGQFPESPATLNWHDWAFRGVLLAALPGLIPLVRCKRWDVLAMIAGLIAGTASFHVVAGRDAIRTEWVSYLRYGLFAVAPAVIALACITRGLLIDAQCGWRTWMRNGQDLALMAVATCLLLSVKSCWFDRFTRAGHESIWSFRTDAKDPHRQVLAAIFQDMRTHDRDRIRIYAQDQWTQRPLCFLAGARGDVEVVNLDESARTPEKIAEALQGRMAPGTYVVGPAGGIADLAVAGMIPADSRRSWAATLNGSPYLVLHRAWPGEEIADVARRESTASSPK